VYNKVVTAPANALQPLIPAAQVFTQQLVQVGDFIASKNPGQLCGERYSVPDFAAGQPVQYADWAAGRSASGL
jgi:hypothetical protein